MGKQTNGVGIKYFHTTSEHDLSSITTNNKTYDKLPSNTVSSGSSSKIRDLISTPLFPYNTFLTRTKTEWPVDTVSSVVSCITRCH